jgi:uncharacterized protein (TIRG00374 family)
LHKHLKFAAVVLIAATLVWWFGRSLDWVEVRRSLAQANPLLLIMAAAAMCTTYLLRSLRWRTLLSPSAPATTRELFAATTIGLGAVFLFGPAGEVVRPAMLPLLNHHVRPSASLVTATIERMCDVLALVVLFALTLLLFPALGDRASEFGHVRELGMLLLMLAAFTPYALLLFKRHSSRINSSIDDRLARWRFVPDRIRRVSLHLFEQLESAAVVLANPRALTRVVLLTVAQWCGVVLTGWLILRAFHLPFGFKEALFVTVCGLIGSLAPLPAGSAGAFHAAMASGLIFLGVPAEQATAISIMNHLAGFSPAYVFGLYYLLRSDIDFTRLRLTRVRHAHAERPGAQLASTSNC